MEEQLEEIRSSLNLAELALEDCIKQGKQLVAKSTCPANRTFLKSMEDMASNLRTLQHTANWLKEHQQT